TFDEPGLNGITEVQTNDWDSLSRILCGERFVGGGDDENVDFDSYQFIDKRRKSLRFILGVAILVNDIFVINITKHLTLALKSLKCLARTIRTHPEKSDLGKLCRLLRLSHSTTDHEHESDYQKAQPFWILDCRFSIIGSKAKKCRLRCLSHVLATIQ